MEFIFLCSRVNALILLLTLCSPYKFIQSPMDFGPLNLLQTTHEASLDFGRIVFNTPSAVLKPQSKTDIALLLSSLSASSLSRVTVSARGAGHSIHGQAQALDGIVVEMESLPVEMEIHKRKGEDGISFADVSGGALWIEVLKESLKFGLAPRSWTDYLYLTVGGTLSNAGISGQTFKFGPQISNVLQLEIVTGQGELVTCSRTENSELFYSVLGGLGQFGIITKARILLQDAPEKVKWIRAFYDDFDTFTKDQELLVSMPDLVDYVEGFIVLNEQSLHSSSVGFPGNVGFTPDFGTREKPKVYYCIEFGVHDYQLEHMNIDEVVRDISRQMSYMQSQLYSVDVSYFDFLERVRMEELSLRRQGLWDVHHPWLNMFVPKSGIVEFKDLLTESISPDDFMGLILIYPLLRDKWDGNMSAVLPEVGSTDQVMYVVGVLQSANPDTCNHRCLHDLLQHQCSFAQTAHDQIGAKQYLGHQPSPLHWRSHFGRRWDQFARRKSQFDPNYILGPGQGIFTNPHSASSALR
ncbi:Cytokinin dehydrogenase 3 [Rhynchospora pubera]|uniref:cytokinin dehydrogenase n=1 Tax=Rhynchospora pubera TaxID=906938 RepID=A0AAV8F0S3_9POAL|nr:Cytokinin dehydrogenase 3 [Rhynchospora pubera]